MNVGLPPAQRILVLAPHPDDESLSCGGMIVRYVRDGAVVSLLVVSDGAAIEEPDGYHEDVVAIRRQELTAAAAILGISQLHDVIAGQGPPDEILEYFKINNRWVAMSFDGREQESETGDPVYNRLEVCQTLNKWVTSCIVDSMLY